MVQNFMESETKENLMRAFAGESMARNRYIFSASLAKKEHQHVLEQLFRFTAGQEQQHAKIFYNLMKDLSGQTVVIEAGYPVDHEPSLEKLLRAAQSHEYEEHDSIYKSFGETAKQEGFTGVASSFLKIAEIEKTHGDRFGRFAGLLEDGGLYISDVEIDWICLKCGHIYHGYEAPKLCPVCGHDQGYFIRMDLCPFE